MFRDPDGHAATGLREYVCQVVELLGKHEVGSVDSDVELPPAMAMIVLRAVVPTLPSQGLVLTWDEVNGWATRVAVDDQGDTIALAYLGGGDVLAEPSEVAEFLRDSVEGDHPGTIYPPRFRGLGANDDLESRLAHFA